MGWNNVDNKHKKHTDKEFVSCTEKYELDYLKRIIKEEYPHLSENKIDSAIGSCCSSIPAPRPRDKFMQCLKNKLAVY